MGGGPITAQWDGNKFVSQNDTKPVAEGHYPVDPATAYETYIQPNGFEQPVK